MPGEIQGRYQGKTRRNKREILEEIPGRYQRDTMKIPGRCQGISEEIPGRYHGDTREMPGRCQSMERYQRNMSGYTRRDTRAIPLEIPGHTRRDTRGDTREIPL